VIKFILRIKEQETRLTIQEHDDDVDELSLMHGANKEILNTVLNSKNF